MALRVLSAERLSRDEFALRLWNGGADVLAGRKTVGSIKGKIVFAGHKPSKSFLRRYTGYVEQFGATPALSAAVQHIVHFPSCDA